MLFKVCDNDKFEMQPSFSSICYDIYTCGDTERIHETERMQIKYLKNDVLLSLPEERERHSFITRRKAIAKSRKMSVAEFLRRSENNNELF